MFKKIIYYFYQKKLEKEISGRKVPAHIGIILDGNRRYAEKRRLDSISMGHEEGAGKLGEVLKWCASLGIKYVTVWALSTDNMKRERDELERLLEIIQSQLQNYIDSNFIKDNDIKVKIIGKRDLLPESLLATIDTLEEKTSSHSGLTLHVALGYGGRQEICDAIINFVSDNMEDLNNSLLPDIITVENISKYLYVKDAPDPDLIIRTSGEIRLSGFLLWQSAYSEFYFCDAYWPEFREIDFLRAIRSYQLRRIRLGK